jgi:poly-gamma-glutamate synthesis protein (capsule biosynthesis protein)
MKKTFIRELFIIGLFIISILLTACSNFVIAKEPEMPLANNPENEENVSRQPSPTPIREPLTIYLENTIPDGVLQKENLLVVNDRDAALWFGPAGLAPEGKILTTAEVIYALAAPFPTLTDDISLEVLQAFWQGIPMLDMTEVAKLYVPVELGEVLARQWGNYAPQQVTLIASPLDPEKIWDENAWVILPFDKLNPMLKVISLDGDSPLYSNFYPEGYPLTLTFHLVQNPEYAEEMTVNDIQPLLNAIQATNRDIKKMTTLVMTGVTALVRTTAYKMEENGLLYPGEAIVDWLSGADLTHISNEVSFYEDCPFPSSQSIALIFCSDPKYIALLEYVGVDIVELTGNHNNDMLALHGVDVFRSTLEMYVSRGWTYYGGGFNLEDAISPKTIDHNGNPLAFIGCNASGPDYAWATDSQGGAAPCGDYAWLVDEIRQLRSEGYLPIVTLQYYEDYTNYPQDYMIRDFNVLADAGAIIVNGSQAHIAKGFAFSSGTFIDYGLGNLFFDQMGVTDTQDNYDVRTRWEIIQRHTFYDGQYLSTELLTAMLEDYSQPRPMTSEERLIFLESLFTTSGWSPQ